MVRRGVTTKGPRARAQGASSRPTPVPASEAEVDDISKKIHGLTLADSTAILAREAAKKSFRFLDLPPELRITIYGHYFHDVDRVIDLEHDNHSRIFRKLVLLKTCRTIYREAAHFFYSTRTFRIFPTTPGKYFKTKKPLLARLNARQRNWITSLELRLGPGFTNPPRGWVVNPKLGLGECVNVRKLTVFVECDPSDGYFNGFRKADSFYETFSQNLLQTVLADMPFVDCLTFDGYPGVKKSGAMMRGLLEIAVMRGMLIRWGPERGWTDEEEEETRVSTKIVSDLMLGQMTQPPALDIAVVA
ncbi:hypothetical protein QBC42DRAFT_26043 [Cladorrhinum samala]|uniref:F-box domain-containing protein n=1 Tax=Cladorrhinum samala TaxID=585594 RepID=A0AAV9I010_9PEZI|nr:hypothetical protein QBC42DRAFT_26043 [Cladorrhinum samala]